MVQACSIKIASATFHPKAGSIPLQKAISNYQWHLKAPFLCCYCRFKANSCIWSLLRTQVKGYYSFQRMYFIDRISTHIPMKRFHISGAIRLNFDHQISLSLISLFPFTISIFVSNFDSILSTISGSSNLSQFLRLLFPGKHCMMKRKSLMKAKGSLLIRSCPRLWTKRSPLSDWNSICTDGWRSPFASTKPKLPASPLWDDQKRPYIGFLSSCSSQALIVALAGGLSSRCGFPFRWPLEGQ